MQPSEIFLSHSSSDISFAGKLAETLKRHGLPIWYSPSNIVGAQQWHDEIGAALNRCDWFIVILSTAAVDSMWVKRELSFALEQKRLDNRIIPLLLEPCEHRRLSWVLSSLQIVDFQRSFDESCRELLRVWGLGYQPP